MKTEKVMLFAALISANIIIWYDAVGPGFIVGVILTTIFFILIRQKR